MEKNKDLKKLEIYESLLNEAHIIIISYDENGKVVFVSPGVERILGYNAEGLLKEKWWKLTCTSKEKEKLFKDKINDAISGKIEVDIKPYEREMRCKDGKYKWIEWSVSKGLNETYISVGNDITGRILSELELNKAKEFAEESVKVKNKFLTNMSHEIRTPLNAVIGFTDLLLESELNSEQMMQLQTMRDSGEILLSLINDVLDLTKLESEKLDLEEISFNLPKQLHKIVQLMKVKAYKKEIELDIKIDPNTPNRVIGDPTRLGQIMLNLIGNAIKFTNKGYVSVVVKPVNETENTTDINFKITDTGIGIVSNKVNTVFGAFNQAKSDTSRIYGGTGLGLTIVKKLVNILKGSITVRSKFGEGSVFEMTLPLKKGLVENEKEDKEQSLTFGEPLGLNILLVEDNKVNQLLAKTRLERWACKVDIANNGIEGVKKMQKNIYDLVLMDIQMPIMDGYEATQIIRKDISDHASKIPIIAITAYTSKDDIRRALNAGMNDYILKPFKPENFYNILKKYGDLSKNLMQITHNESNKESINESNNHYTDLKFIRQETFDESSILILLIEQFIKDIDGFLKAVDPGLIEKDWDLLHKVTHKIKPSISMFGITKMEPIIHLLVTTFKEEKNLENVEDQLSTCKEIFGHVKRELLVELESLGNE